MSVTEDKALSSTTMLGIYKEGLDDIININTLFTSAVFIGLSFSNTTETLESREESAVGTIAGCVFLTLSLIDVVQIRFREVNMHWERMDCVWISGCNFRSCLDLLATLAFIFSVHRVETGVNWRTRRK
ncbi:hypothetical protein CK203_046044 [Vitis vinifera]|uniref:Uncharacterized protein n=1 Tax=Vitis vinifera TaxID=29760 RepID=A0A438HGZ2_VITVI|nr:hypothetical protein CK203_046044 [Vitis vinifera]